MRLARPERPEQPERRWRRAVLAAALGLAFGAGGGASTVAATATAIDSVPDRATPAALADLGLALLRDTGTPNAVVSPLAVAAALGMVHAGTKGHAEREIESLFGPAGAATYRRRLPTLLRQLAGSGNSSDSSSGSAPPPFVMAGRVWMADSAAPTVPAAYLRRLTTRFRADAARIDFSASESARGRINAWTAEHSAGRIAELLPAGSVSAATLVTLTSAVHFRSAWQRPFDPALTAARPFTTAAGATQAVPTLVDERGVAQAVVDGSAVMSLPFAAGGYALLLALPAPGASLDAMLAALDGARLARWQAALQPLKCELALPKFSFAPKAASLRTQLQALGLKTVFTPAADLRPMLGRQARGVHLADLVHAAGMAVDENGGEAVAAAAATVQGKSLALPLPACALDRPFLFVLLHEASGTPLFVGRVGDPTLTD